MKTNVNRTIVFAGAALLMTAGTLAAENEITKPKTEKCSAACSAGTIPISRCVAPTLEIFLDGVSLRSGQNWGEELWQRIPLNDVFYLFWSVEARNSHWVEQEWRCALKTWIPNSLRHRPSWPASILTIGGWRSAGNPR